MEPLELLKSKIAGFPGYADDTSRERSDELVRSYLGEALADLQTRLEPLADGVNQRVGDLLLRTGFVNQTAYRIYEDGARTRTDFGAIENADVAVVELAEDAPSVERRDAAFVSRSNRRSAGCPRRRNGRRRHASLALGVL